MAGRTVNSRRSLRGGVISTAAIFAFAACRPGGDPAYARGSTVVIAARDDRDVLPDVNDFDFLFFLPLATRDKGELEGRLAKSWEHSADFKEWTYHLRTDVRWQDGVPTTAHDVKFTLDLLGHPDVAIYPGMFATVVDDSTVTIRAEKPHYISDIVYYPRHLLKELHPKQFKEWEFWFRPVGNGPYRFVRYVPQTLMEFETSPDYFGAKPRIDRVILKFVGDAWLTELLAGNVDIAFGSRAQISRVTRDPRFRVYHGVPFGALAIYWRTDHPLFRDPRVRRALTLAIDREELRAVLSLPENIPVLDGIPTARQLARGNLLPPIAYDSLEAARLLEAAGWRDSDGDGIRDKNGAAFRFTALVHPAPGFNRMAVYIQASLRRVGVAMDIQPLDGSALRDRLRSGNYDAALTRSALPEIWLPAVFGPKGHLGYRNPELIALIERLSRTADPVQRDEIHSAMTRIFQADAPVTFLLPEVWTAFAHRRIQGLSSPSRADPVGSMEELWIEER